MTRIIIRKKQCYKCKGSGEITHVDPFAAVFTLGISALVDLADPDTCNACNGMGYIEETETIDG